MPRYEVEVEYLGRLRYVVDGDTPEDAERKGGLVFMSEDDIDGELRSAKATEVPPGTPDGSAMELFDGEDEVFEEEEEEEDTPCDENCLTHAKGCDGFCDHLAGHINACCSPE